jgi:peptidoglycan/LPS O-acetylase OafA/YrhL
MLCTLPFAWFWMIPQDLEDFSRSLISIPFFLSNFLFYSTSDYFSTSSEFKPLIHTWSLAVEEQYYILFPLFLMLIWKLGKKWSIFLLSIIAIASFYIAKNNSLTKPLFAFYMLQTRAFEILIGSLTALLFKYKKELFHKKFSIKIEKYKSKIEQSLSFAGLTMMLYAILFFDKNTQNVTFFSLIPVIGTALVLAFATNNNFVGKLLGYKIFVGIGLISYSAYLWHQPLLAFARLKAVDNNLSQIFLIFLCLISFLLAFFSWKYIENPFRNKSKITTKILFISTFSISFILILIGLIIFKNNGFKNRLNSEQQKIISFQNKDELRKKIRENICSLEPENTFHDFKPECYIGKTNNTYLIWGDSLAATSYIGLKSIHDDTLQLTASSCHPTIDKKFPDRPNCYNINNFAKETISKLRLKKIFLQASWVLNSDQKNLIQNITKTIEFIKKASPQSQIIIIGSLPSWEQELPKIILRKNLSLDNEKYIKLPNYKKLKEIDEKLKTLEKFENVKFISALDQMCVEEKCLGIIKYKEEYWITSPDFHHLNEASSIFLFNKIKNLF